MTDRLDRVARQSGGILVFGVPFGDLLVAIKNGWHVRPI